MRLPALLGLAIADLRELFEPLLDLQQDVELDGGLLPLLEGRLDQLGGLDREVAAVEEALALQDDRVQQSGAAGELLRFSMYVRRLSYSGRYSLSWVIE